MNSVMDRTVNSEWHEEYQNHIESVKIVQDCPDVLSNLPFKSGDQVFLVWAEWSNGDSLGQSYCGSAEALAVFMDLDIANEFADQCRECKDKNHMIDLTTTDEQTFHFQLPWDEYFDTLESIHIDPVILE